MYLRHSTADWAGLSRCARGTAGVHCNYNFLVSSIRNKTCSESFGLSLSNLGVSSCDLEELRELNEFLSGRAALKHEGFFRRGTDLPHRIIPVLKDTV